MKHYTYISDSKIDMLFPQIPAKFLSTLTTEVSINIGVVKTTVKEKLPEADRYSKLTAVLAFLDSEGKVGTLESDSPYFRGLLQMKWGLYEQTGFVFFVTGPGDPTVGLGGSLAHLVGSEQVVPLKRSSWGSVQAGIERSLAAELNISPLVARAEHGRDAIVRNDADDYANMELAYIVDEAAHLVDGPRAKFEFVALRLAEGSGNGGSRVIVGTPLYVAYAI